MKIVISGYGRMGHMIENILKEQEISYFPTEDIKNIDLAIAKESVCIDFTTPAAFRENYKFLADNFKAVVVGTTGWNDIEQEVIAYFSEKNTTMIYASNFSIGVNIFFKLSEIASKLTKAFSGYTPSVTEVHHIHKLDKPSGTAKTLANVVKSSCGIMPDIESIREGEVNGVHELTFTSKVDSIDLKHEAFSREGFAKGAVEAAKMTSEIEGVHEFKELLEDKFNQAL